MATTAPRTTARGPLRDWLGNAALWGTAPGWVLSLGFHTVLFVALITLTQLPSCRGDYSGEEGTGFREIGLKAREDANSAPAAGPSAPGQDTVDAQLPEMSAIPDAVAPTISDQPPVPLSLPEVGAGPAVLGLGPPPLAGAGGAPPAAASSSTGTGNPGSRGGGGGQGQAPGQTSLFGVNDSGKTFVYLIDRSFSMDEFGAFRAAKSELLTSIQRLTEVQQFQVIFYNQAPLTLVTREARFKMFFGTDAQRQQVSEQIRAISPDGGTRHLEAIQEALKYNPDVIFMLTDGSTPALTKVELDGIKSRNRAGTRIHCIEFGTGAQPVAANGTPVGNFLMKLSSMNDGKYTYRDVKQFAADK